MQEYVCASDSAPHLQPRRVEEDQRIVLAVRPKPSRNLPRVDVGPRELVRYVVGDDLG
jgi:hypothetical protein